MFFNKLRYPLVFAVLLVAGIRLCCNTRYRSCGTGKTIGTR